MISIQCKFCRETCLKKYKHVKYKIKCGQTDFYCSDKCVHADHTAEKIIKNCLFCKKEFESSTRLDSNKCCSKICRAKYSQTFIDVNKISESMKKAWIRGDFKNHALKIRKYKICSVCGESFYGNKIYCSLNCLKNSNFSVKISETRKKMFRNNLLKVTGGTTKWINYNDIKVQGSYEFRTCKILDIWKSMGKIKQWKYSSDRFQYVGIDGNFHNYLVDFKIWNNDNSFYYIETKGYQTENDKLKWDAVRKCGHQLLVWFNEDILKEENNLRLNSSNGRAEP